MSCVLASHPRDLNIKTQTWKPTSELHAHTVLPFTTPLFKQRDHSQINKTLCYYLCLPLIP